ncbi:MAG TPA: biotin--[acetyl-CoA-carboxylase] ligase [Terrimesophilobacter sp.]|nr:biotin--[acetyl-CoA-carboxylase] ligase [Terrimesophilobacter sp.]
MTFRRSRNLGIDLHLLESAESTNDELAARAKTGDLAEFTTIATLNQTAGRGRLGREWVSPAGKTLAVSVLLKPTAPSDTWGWIPLLAGVCMTRAVARVVPGASVSLKWPNDVLINTERGERKVSGVLSELVRDGVIVVGVGLNLSLEGDELPVETATSLSANGAQGSPRELADTALAAFLTELRDGWAALEAAGGDAGASGLRLAVTELCGTLGREVRVERPGRLEHVGTAVGIDTAGHLLVGGQGAVGGHNGAANSEVLTVAAGDVTHLRYE